MLRWHTMTVAHTALKTSVAYTILAAPLAPAAPKATSAITELAELTALVETLVILDMTVRENLSMGLLEVALAGVMWLMLAHRGTRIALCQAGGNLKKVTAMAVQLGVIAAVALGLTFGLQRRELDVGAAAAAVAVMMPAGVSSSLIERARAQEPRRVQ